LPPGTNPTWARLLAAIWQSDRSPLPPKLHSSHGYSVVRPFYYGWYSNASRGKRRKAQGEGEAPDTIEEVNEVSASAAKRAWARLIKQVYEVDPLVCPRCGGAMRILAFIEQPEVIAKILAHLGLWPAPAHSPPFARYPLPSARQRVEPRDQGVRSVQGPRDHAVGARGRRGLPGPPPGVRLSP